MGPHGVLPLEETVELLEGADVEKMVLSALGKLARSGMANCLFDPSEPIVYELHVDTEGKPFVYFETVGR